jgi:polar amino acid transport system substrate-binding protein
VNAVTGNATLEQANWLTRRQVLRGGLGATAAAAASSVLAACGGVADTKAGTLERLRVDGAKLGVSAGPPSSGVEGGKAIGIFPEVADVVLKRLGVDKVSPVLTSFDGIIPGLQAGRVDLALPGLYITATRCKAILFSHPVLRYGDALVVPRGNPGNFKTMDDVAKSDAKVGTIAGSTGAAQLKQLGIPASRQLIFPDLPSILDGMKAGRVGVSGSDAIALGYLLKQGSLSNDLELVPLATAKFSGAIGFAKNATDLQTAFNEELRKAQADGALTPIFEKWNVPADALDGVAKLTWQDQCRTAE